MPIGGACVASVASSSSTDYRRSVPAMKLQKLLLQLFSAVQSIKVSDNYAKTVVVNSHMSC
jgi:hypothetical protein